MATPLWIQTMLKLRGIPFEELHHTETYTAQEMAQREHVSGHRVAKVVVVMADERPVELVLPASRHVNLNLVQSALGCQVLRLANEEEMERFFTGCERGAVPPLRQWSDVAVLMDRTLSVEGPIIFQAATHTDAIRLNFADWYEMVSPQVASFTEPAELARA